MNEEKAERRRIARRVAEGFLWRKQVPRVALMLLMGGGACPLAGAAQALQLLDSRVTQHSVGETICRPGYADEVALPFDRAMEFKDRLLAERGIDVGDAPSYALDQRVPVVLGGSPDAAENLDLLPWGGHDGARRKALLTVRLKRCVCSGKISLAKAQAAISGDWVHEYERLTRMACGATASSGFPAAGDDEP